jgi:formate/nitrite transporter FocA (FNT family)
LFTGKVAYLFYNERRAYIIFLLIVFVGNYLGTAIVAELLRLTRNGPILEEAARNLSIIKINDSPLSLFILGLFCNIFVVLAVEGYRSNPDQVGKYIGIILSIMFFIISGFEHSIADMFYFQMARIWSIDAIKAMFFIVCGNIVGGLLIPSVKLLDSGIKN